MKLFFPGQQEGERIHLVTRPHWIILAMKIAVWLIFVALFVFLDYLAEAVPTLTEAPYLSAFNLFKTIYLMFLVAAVFYIWIIYYLNYQVVTNERVVDVDQGNLLLHTTSELHLSQVQDVTAEIKGFLGNIFDYGNVYLQSAGAKVQFEFDDVPNPHALAKLILDLYEKVPKQNQAPQGGGNLGRV
ncbi:MAG: PH domain-containing protein [Candidatus Doudnabacteria bacterium]|nr:PH domain-containing protein [bacterium]MDZ4243733.1 PH domain-containing protein [Candidatus Doudnabacteria bacterium]